MLRSFGGLVLAWGQRIIEIRETHLRAQCAEIAGDWHIAVQAYLCCLEAAERAHDLQATCFFASRLANSYRAMGFSKKAESYLELVELAAR